MSEGNKKNYRITYSEDGLFLHLLCSEGKAYGINLFSRVSGVFWQTALSQWLKENCVDPIEGKVIEIEQKDI